MTTLSRSLRVLVVLPLYGGSLPVGRFCVEALKELGHTVEVFEAPSFHSAFSALKDLRVTTDRLEYLENSFLQVVSQAVLAKVETFEPDLVFCLAQAPLNRQALKRLRKDGVATAMWFVEDFRLFTYWRSFAPFYDYFAVIQYEPFISELRDIGVDNALYLPMAALPSMHRKLELSPMEQRKYGSDVSFLGAGYPNRRIAFRQLTHLDFKIWGTEWDGEPLLERHVQMKGARISSEDCVKIYNATKINLNLHSSVNARELVSGGDFVNPRTFELAACGAFQLVDRRSLMSDLFDSDELVTFGSMEEMLDKIQTYLGDEAERQAIAEKAQARVLRDHTYANRMRTLTEFIASRREGWPVPRSESAMLPDDIPEELRVELAALMQRLNIPADAAFQDIVWAIRQQNGQLSSVETAVLFLDEWKKQYQK
ncbi:glycosyltransferase [Desulfovibrio mangrovi]|uniref:CgeB family protein n=1 Tax=Desulfovibrio mangrovi TaxID=2976983 RepID=UPI0022474045|nr:glycosyltransferase [Desulfovibrio mangrovi]UZP68347.1 glycosyltransferase [Desulfovibrio mangrovi]